MKLIASTAALIGALSFAVPATADQAVDFGAHSQFQSQIVLSANGAGHGKVCSYWDQFIGKCQKN